MGREEDSKVCYEAGPNCRRVARPLYEDPLHIPSIPGDSGRNARSAKWTHTSLPWQRLLRITKERLTKDTLAGPNEPSSALLRVHSIEHRWSVLPREERSAQLDGPGSLGRRITLGQAIFEDGHSDWRCSQQVLRRELLHSTTSVAGVTSNNLSMAHAALRANLDAEQSPVEVALSHVTPTVPASHLRMTVVFERKSHHHPSFNDSCRCRMPAMRTWSATLGCQSHPVGTEPSAPMF